MGAEKNQSNIRRRHTISVSERVECVGWHGGAEVFARDRAGVAAKSKQQQAAGGGNRLYLAAAAFVVFAAQVRSCSSGGSRFADGSKRALSKPPKSLPVAVGGAAGRGPISSIVLIAIWVNIFAARKCLNKSCGGRSCRASHRSSSSSCLQLQFSNELKTNVSIILLVFAAPVVWLSSATAANAGSSVVTNYCIGRGARDKAISH